MLDFLIKNGTVIDGTGASGKRQDVGVKSGKITEISENIPEDSAKQTVNAAGSFVVPGFIDIQNHSDSYWTLFDQPEQTSLLAQGITSIIVGNCGSSLAPLLNAEAIKSIQKWHSLQGANINWTSVGEFLDVLAKMPLGVNVGTLIGHSTLRRGLLGDAVRELTSEELKIMNRSLIEGLEQGAFGMSLGLIYAHEVNSSKEEIEQLARNMRGMGKYLSVHLRSEASHILDSLDEVVELSQRCEVPIKIAHLKLRGRRNWHLFDQMMSKIELAYHQGTKISFDVYPYHTSWSVLYTYLPKWAYEGGRAQTVATLSDPHSRRKILDYLRNQNHDFGSIMVAEAAGNEGLVGKTVHQIAHNQGLTNEEAMLNILAATQAQIIVFDHNLSVEQVDSLVFSPLSLIATDAAGYSKKGSGLIHPRCYGTMPRFLNLVATKRNIKWEEAIRKISGEPASLLGLTDRGVIKIGGAADIVVFDPSKIADHGDYQIPDILPSGIELTMVNGIVAYTQNQFVNSGGKVLSR